MVHRRSHLSSLSFRTRVCHPNTRIYVRLLGPCFKTGRLEPFRQHPKRWCEKTGQLFLPMSPSQRAVWEQGEKGGSRFQNDAADLSPAQGMTRSYNTRTKESELPSPGFLPQTKLMLTCLQASAPHRPLAGSTADCLQAILVPSVSLLAISRTV
jgi:hypothetical protein